MKLMFFAVTVMVIARGFSWPEFNRPVVWSADFGEHIAGQLIVELSPEMRGKVGLKPKSKDGEAALFGIPALDSLNRKWRVEEIMPLWRHPKSDPIAQKYGCDLQFLIQFDVTQDIAPVAMDYKRLSEVSEVCPNNVMWGDELTFGKSGGEVPNDSLYDYQWYFKNIGAPWAWHIAKGRTRVINIVLDDGLDLFHPDIEPNLWINTLEDVNGNGKFDTLLYPDGDLDGVDQDMNGYIDDVVGWDFISGEPIPLCEGNDDHGTHCWGVTNAATNNRIGVAGVTWNSRSMAFRCGNSGGMNVGAAAAAIYYAVPMGAWSVSMSFGSPQPNQTMADACRYAWESGMVLFGSAGNDYSEVMRYPACYEGVENVAASTPNDTKASWSNYGAWVDITAPGEHIYSTLPGGNYGPMDGTSMSAPLASGIACWIKSFDSTVSNQTCIQMMHDACDSMPDPLYLQGKLGAGRVSMANIILPLYYCDLKLISYRFNDQGGNGNGRPDPGEVVSLIVTYANTPNWRTATNVTATLNAIGTDVYVLKNTATFPDIPGGESGNCSADSFVIQVADSAPPHRVRFFLTANANPEPAYPDTFFVVQCGEPRLLVVDDDDGTNYERFYTAACDSNGVLYSVHSVASSGSPPPETLIRYPVVLWFTGDAKINTLTPTDQTNLAGYLNNGGKLILSSQNVAWELNGTQFLSDYLHAEFVDDSTGKYYLPGITSDPITRGDTMVAAGGGGASNARSTDAIRPINGAAACARFRDYPDTTTAPLIRYAGSHRLVYFSIPFEAIDHATARYLQRWTLIKRILEWLGERIPGTNEPTMPVTSKRAYTLHITPSPFSRSATVEFIAPITGTVVLRIYTITGRVIASQKKAVNFGVPASFRLDGSKLPNGTYIVQLVTPGEVYAQKAVVLH